MQPASRLTHAAALFGCGAFVFLLFIGRPDIVNTHEARVAQTAREVAASGWPWRATLVEVPAPRLVETGGRKVLQGRPPPPPPPVHPPAGPPPTRGIPPPQTPL